MTVLLIPVASLKRSKSRLESCLSREQIKDFTMAMLEDMLITLSQVNSFREVMVYCESNEILDVAREYGCSGIKEAFRSSKHTFDDTIHDMNDIAINKFKATATVIAFLDLILISKKNFYDISELIKKHQLVACPAVKSAGISILGRNPPTVVAPSFSDPGTPSLISLYNNARENGVEDIAIYDSFRASFDVDTQEDLIMAYEYLKILNLTDKKSFKFLKNNLKLALQKIDGSDNRKFRVVKRSD